MKKIFILFLFCSVIATAQKFTFVMHTDSLFIKNTTTGTDSFLVTKQTNTALNTIAILSTSTNGNVIATSGNGWASMGNTGGWTELRVAGSNATTTGQALVDITGLVSGTPTNSTLYEIEAVLYVTTTAVTTGTEYGIGAGGSGNAANVFVILTGTTTALLSTSQTINAPATASTALLTTSGSTGIIIIKGFVLTRSTGTATISIQHLKVTSGTSTVKIGSVLRYRLAQ